MISEVTTLETLQAHDRAVVCFTNPLTCAPCKLLAPHYENAASALQDAVPFLEVNVLDHMDIAVEYGVMGTPTVIFIDGEERTTIESRTTMPLIAEIKDLLDS